MARIQIKGYNANWASHMPLLIKALMFSEGPVLELGIGPFSTPLLHVLCADQGRKLVSYESDPYYFERHKDFNNGLHEIRYVDANEWAGIDIDNTEWGLVFVDQHPANRRAPEAARMANKATFVVIHDSDAQNEKNYHYSSIYPLFKYRYDYTKLVPNTTILSNFVDVSNIL